MGAILAVPHTVIILTIMENFDGTRMLAILMRYTGEEKKEERQRAKERASDLLSQAIAALVSEEETEKPA